MNKLLKVILYIFIIILLSLLLSPFISLILPEKLTNRSYYRLFYHVLVDKETAGRSTNKEKALRLFQYVVEHQFAQGTPYKCKPMESLIYGEAYCDFQARTLNILLAVAGIRSRYAMLLDKDGISPHTLNEVYLDKKWCVFDTTTNIIFKDKRGNFASLQDLSEDVSLILNNEKLIAIKEYDIEGYNGFIGWYQRMFPVPLEPRRSTPDIYQSHLLDRINDVYFNLFKYNFFNFYQDLYLKFKLDRIKEDDKKLFLLARNYHLAYRYDLAGECYNLLLKNYPQSSYRQDVLFFCGILYFDMGNPPRSVYFLKMIVEKDYRKWLQAASYFLGKSYSLLGKKEESLRAYRMGGLYKLSPKIIQELKEENL